MVACCTHSPRTHTSDMQESPSPHALPSFCGCNRQRSLTKSHAKLMHGYGDVCATHSAHENPLLAPTPPKLPTAPNPLDPPKTPTPPAWPERPPPPKPARPPELN